MTRIPYFEDRKTNLQNLSGKYRYSVVAIQETLVCFIDALIYLFEEIYEGTTSGDEISRQDITDYTSMSRDSAIRTLNELERDNIILLDGRTIRILDTGRLHEITTKG